MSGGAFLIPGFTPRNSWFSRFEVQFRGSEQNPAEQEVELTTAPDEHGATHWGQQAFYLHPPQRAADGDVLKGTFEMVRRSDNHRLMTVSFVFSHGARPHAAACARRRERTTRLLDAAWVSAASL